jgi:hypothetical protein
MFVKVAIAQRDWMQVQLISLTSYSLLIIKAVTGYNHATSHLMNVYRLPFEPDNGVN